MLVERALKTEPELECLKCGERVPYRGPLLDCPVCHHEILDVRYDYETLGPQLPDLIRDRPFRMWRYLELLPLRDAESIVTMGEGGTPLLRAGNLGMMLGRDHVYIKDERQGPTGSFKDRQASLAISVMKENGVRECVASFVGYPKDVVSRKALKVEKLFGQAALDKRLMLDLYRPLEAGVIKYSDTDMTSDEARSNARAATDLVRHAVSLARPRPDELVYAVIGCPAEELGIGKRRLVEAGVFEGVHAALMAHASDMRRAHRLFLGNRKFELVFHGRAAHAAAYPERGLNALDGVIAQPARQ